MLLGSFGILVPSCSPLLVTFIWTSDLCYWQLCSAMLAEHMLPCPWLRIVDEVFTCLPTWLYWVYKPPWYYSIKGFFISDQRCVSVSVVSVCLFVFQSPSPCPRLWTVCSCRRYNTGVVLHCHVVQGGNLHHVSFFISLYILPLRQALSLNLHLDSSQNNPDVHAAMPGFSRWCFD